MMNRDRFSDTTSSVSAGRWEISTVVFPFAGDDRYMTSLRWWCDGRSNGRVPPCRRGSTSTARMKSLTCVTPVTELADFIRAVEVDPRRQGGTRPLDRPSHHHRSDVI